MRLRAALLVSVFALAQGDVRGRGVLARADSSFDLPAGGGELGAQALSRVGV